MLAQLTVIVVILILANVIHAQPHSINTLISPNQLPPLHSKLNIAFLAQADVMNAHTTMLPEQLNARHVSKMLT